MGNQAWGVTYVTLATWLLRETIRLGPACVIENLSRYLVCPTFPYRQILALGGIHLARPCELGDGIRLVPWDQLPASRIKAELSGDGSRLSAIEVHSPTAALMREVTLERRHVAQTAWQNNDDLFPIDYGALQDAMLCLGLVGPVAPYEVAQWPDLPEWVPIFGMPFSAPRFEGRVAARPWPQEAYEQVPQYHQAFVGLASDAKDRMRLRMQRLNSAMRRHSLIDAAIDLGITLESLFLTDIDREEITLRLRLRAARFLGKGYSGRLRVSILTGDLYAARSAAVHRGRLPNPKDLHPPYRSQPLEKLLNAGFSLAAQTITRFLLEGEPIDWRTIELGPDIG